MLIETFYDLAFNKLLKICQVNYFDIKKFGEYSMSLKDRIKLRDWFIEKGVSNGVFRNKLSARKDFELNFDPMYCFKIDIDELNKLSLRNQEYNIKKRWQN